MYIRDLDMEHWFDGMKRHFPGSERLRTFVRIWTPSMRFQSRRRPLIDVDTTSSSIDSCKATPLMSQIYFQDASIHSCHLYSFTIHFARMQVTSAGQLSIAWNSHIKPKSKISWYVILEVNLAVASTCLDDPSIRQISRAAIEMILHTYVETNSFHHHLCIDLQFCCPRPSSPRWRKASRSELWFLSRKRSYSSSSIAL